MASVSSPSDWLDINIVKAEDDESAPVSPPTAIEPSSSYSQLQTSDPPQISEESNQQYSHFRSLLLKDSINLALPYTILETSSPAPDTVAYQEDELYQLFDYLNSENTVPEIKELFELYERERSRLDTDRKVALESNLFVDSHQAINQYYDSERLNVISRIWQSLHLYEQYSTADSTTFTVDASGAIETIGYVSEDTSVAAMDTHNFSLSDFMNSSVDSGFNESRIEERLHSMADSTTPIHKQPKIVKTFASLTDRCRYLPPDGLKLLKSWYQAHYSHPYPSMQEAQELAEQGGLTVAQVKKWFANKRVRSFNTATFQSTTKKRTYERLDERTQAILNEWLVENMDKPYPTTEQKRLLSRKTGISVSQVSSWFSNKRNRKMPKYVQKHLEKHPEDASALIARRNAASAMEVVRPRFETVLNDVTNTYNQSPAPNRHVVHYHQSENALQIFTDQSEELVEFQRPDQGRVNNVQYNTYVSYQLPPMMPMMVYPEFPPMIPEFIPIPPVPAISSPWPY